MARRPDPDRIHVARRAAAIARLVSDGHGRDAAARIVRDWEASLEGRQPTREEWERFARGRPE